jgi:hypothetical protein
MASLWERRGTEYDIEVRHAQCIRTSTGRYVINMRSVNTSGKDGAQIPHLPLGDDYPPGGDNPVRI